MQLWTEEFYSKKYNIVFFHIPKNGMTSMINNLECVQTPFENIPENATTCAVLRDPFTRFISAYTQLQFRVSTLSKDKFGNLTLLSLSGGLENETLKEEHESIRMHSDNTQEVVFTSLLDFCIEPRFGFEKFLRFIENGGFFESHHIPQINWITSSYLKRNINKIDKFINFKNINKEIYNLTKKQVMHYNYKNDKNSRKDLYKIAEPFRQRIVALYKQDYELYNKIFNKGEN